MITSLTWNGDVVPVETHQPATAGAILAVFLRDHPDLWTMGLGLFTMGMRELDQSEMVFPGADLIVRPRVVRA